MQGTNVTNNQRKHIQNTAQALTSPSQKINTKRNSTRDTNAKNCQENAYQTVCETLVTKTQLNTQLLCRT